jgi:hypothetical protein
VVVRLDLHEHVHGVLVRGIPAGLALLGREPAWDDPALHDRGVVLVGDDGMPRATASVCRIIPNSERSCTSPSTTKSALKILCRQCSLLAWANIISSTSLGLRPSPVNASTR